MWGSCTALASQALAFMELVLHVVPKLTLPL
jgi:hypothetical protein